VSDGGWTREEHWTTSTARVYYYFFRLFLDEARVTGVGNGKLGIVNWRVGAQDGPALGPEGHFKRPRADLFGKSILSLEMDIAC
jgi:hypothetical protein